MKAVEIFFEWHLNTNFSKVDSTFLEMSTQPKNATYYYITIIKHPGQRVYDFYKEKINILADGELSYKTQKMRMICDYDELVKTLTPCRGDYNQIKHPIENLMV